MTWVLIVLLVTRQLYVLDTESEAQCRTMQASINEGSGTITLLDGTRLPIADHGALRCMTEAEFEVMTGAGA